MNGFDSLDTQDKTSDMTRFDREVSRGRRRRAEQLAHGVGKLPSRRLA